MPFYERRDFSRFEGEAYGFQTLVFYGRRGTASLDGKRPLNTQELRK